jgi:hypothetical protein
MMANIGAIQAGLTVPGLYGPSKEELSMIGMEAPKI